MILFLKRQEIVYYYDEVQIFVGLCPEKGSHIRVLVEEDNYLILKNTEKELSSFLQGEMDLLTLFNTATCFYQSFMDKKDNFTCFKICKDDLKKDWYPEANFFVNRGRK